MEHKYMEHKYMEHKYMEHKSISYPFDNDHNMVRDAIRNYLKDWDNNVRIQHHDPNKTQGFDKMAWSHFVNEQGMAAIGIPESYGGVGLGRLGYTIIMEEIGYVLFATPFFSTCILSVDIIMKFGYDAIKTEWLHKIANGKIILSPVLDVNEYTLNNNYLSGYSNLVLDAQHADMIIIPIHVDGLIKIFGLSTSIDGLTITPQQCMDITRDFSHVKLDHIHIKDTIKMGETTLDEFQKQIHISLGLLGAECVGGAQRCLDMTLEYTHQRIQFDRPISSFQAIKHRCADMYIAIEASRSASYLAAISEEEEQLETALIAKAYASDSFYKVSRDAIQLHGAIGFTWEYPLHYFFKRARANCAVFNTSIDDYKMLSDLIGLG